MSNRHFNFVVQPIIGRDGLVIAQEALARIPENPIGAFIRELEAAPSPTSLYNFQIKVIEQVCLALHSFPIATPPVWINLSQRSLLSECYLNHVAHLVKAAPQKIGLELTETYTLETPSILADRLAFLVDNLDQNPIILDDFDESPNSVRCLSAFRFNYVKLCRLFVTANVTTQAGRKKLFDAIQNITHRGAKAIAEGIEQKEHYDLLKNLGCFAFQGFLFPPQPAFIPSDLAL